MPGRLHIHEGILVYHRPDGALVFHKKRHSRHIPSQDAKIKARNRPINPNYLHAGDGRAVRSKATTRPIDAAERKKAKKSKKGKKTKK